MNNNYCLDAQTNLLVGLLILTSSLLSLTKVAHAEEVLPFSGIAFTSERSVARNSLPFSIRSIGNLEVSPNEFVQNLNSATNGVKLKNGAILSSTLMNNLQLGQNLVLALAIEKENMKTTTLSISQYQLTFNLDVQVLVFNFREKSIVAAHPIRMTLLNVLGRKPQEQDRKDLARAMFFGDPEQVIFEDLPRSYLIENFVSTIQSITIKPAWRSQIKIKNIGFSEQAKEILAENTIDRGYFKQLAASTLSSSLSSKLGIPILPFIKNDAIENSMTLRFSNTDLMNFKIPEANFHINLFVRGFGSRILRETERTKVVSFISGVRFSILDNDFNDTMMDIKFQSGNVKKLSRSMDIDEWAEYENSFLALLDQIAKQLQKTDKKWVREHATDEKGSKRVIRELKKIRSKVIDQIKG